MSRASVEPRRAELLTALADELGRKAAITILVFHTALAERLGLNLTDLFAGELLSRTGTLTAGELAQLIGLTTGAITGVIDRLEKTGYVRRENDPHDRRRVMVRAIPDAWAKTGAPLYKNLNDKFVKIFEEYSDEELTTIADFMKQISQAYDQEAAEFRTAALAQPQDAADDGKTTANLNADANFRLRANARIRLGGHSHEHLHEHHENARKFSAPLESRTQARLELEAGAVGFHLRGARHSSE